jgi:hypothetical protein
MFVCIMVIIIPEELSTYGSLEQERQQHSGIPFKNLFPQETEKVGQWKAGCAVQHNMYVCVDNCYCCYYELAKLLKCIVVLGYILTFTYSTFLGL